MSEEFVNLLVFLGFFVSRPFDSVLRIIIVNLYPLGA